MPKEPTRKSQRKDAGDVECDWCGKSCRRRGIASHKSGCPKRPELQIQPAPAATIQTSESNTVMQNQQLEAEDSDEALEYVDEIEGVGTPGAL